MTDTPIPSQSASPLSRKRRRVKVLNLGSRFDGGVTAALHAHRRRASAQYLTSSVRVRMGFMPAVSAEEARLALARFLVDNSAFGAGLAGVGGSNQMKAAAIRHQLVIKHSCECVPPLIQDRTIKSALVLPSRGHPLYVQIFKGDVTEPAGNVGANAMMPILTNSCDTSVSFGNNALLPLPPARTPLSPRKHALRSPSPVIKCDQGFRQAIMLSVREAEGLRYTSVDANCWEPIDCVNFPYLAKEADVPTARNTAKRRVSKFPAHLTTAPKFNPANFRNFYCRPFAIQPSDWSLYRLYSKAVVNSSLARRRVASTPKEPPKCRVQIAQRLLLRSYASLSDPLILSAEKRQFANLAEAGNVSPIYTVERAPVIAPLLPCEIVDEPADTDVVEQRFCLLGRRIQPIAEAPDHPETLAFLPIGGNA